MMYKILFVELFDLYYRGAVIKYREGVSIRYGEGESIRYRALRISRKRGSYKVQLIFSPIFPDFLALLNEKLFFENFDCGRS